MTDEDDLQPERPPVTYVAREPGPQRNARRGGGGWDLSYEKGDVFIECRVCETGNWASLQRTGRFCACGAVGFDMEAGRFGSSYGDDAIMLYEVEGWWARHHLTRAARGEKPPAQPPRLQPDPSTTPAAKAAALVRSGLAAARALLHPPFEEEVLPNYWDVSWLSGYAQTDMDLLHWGLERVLWHLEALSALAETGLDDETFRERAVWLLREIGRTTFREPARENAAWRAFCTAVAEAAGLKPTFGDVLHRDPEAGFRLTLEERLKRVRGVRRGLFGRTLVLDLDRVGPR